MPVGNRVKGKVVLRIGFVTNSLPFAVTTQESATKPILLTTLVFKLFFVDIFCKVDSQIKSNLGSHLSGHPEACLMPKLFEILHWT